MARRSISMPALSGSANWCIMRSVICALQWMPLKSLYRSRWISLAATTLWRIWALGSPGAALEMSLKGTGVISTCMSMRSIKGPLILFMYFWIWPGVQTQWCVGSP